MSGPDRALTEQTVNADTFISDVIEQAMRECTDPLSLETLVQAVNKDCDLREWIGRQRIRVKAGTPVYAACTGSSYGTDWRLLVGDDENSLWRRLQSLKEFFGVLDEQAQENPWRMYTELEDRIEQELL